MTELAGFWYEWLKHPSVIGVISHWSLEGCSTIIFKFSIKWFKNFPEPEKKNSMRCRSYPTQISHLSPGETKAQQQPDLPKLSQQLVSWLGLPFPENERHFWFLFFLIYFNWRLFKGISLHTADSTTYLVKKLHSF